MSSPINLRIRIDFQRRRSPDLRPRFSIVQSSSNRLEPRSETAENVSTSRNSNRSVEKCSRRRVLAFGEKMKTSWPSHVLRERLPLGLRSREGNNRAHVRDPNRRKKLSEREVETHRSRKWLWRLHHPDTKLDVVEFTSRKSEPPRERRRSSAVRLEEKTKTRREISPFQRAIPNSPRDHFHPTSLITLSRVLRHRRELRQQLLIEGSDPRSAQIGRFEGMPALRPRLLDVRG